MFLVTRSQVPWSKRLPNRCQENWNKTYVLWLSVPVVRMIIWIVRSICKENIYQHWEKHHSGVPRPMWQPQPLRVEYKGGLPNIFTCFPSLTFHGASPLVAFSFTSSLMAFNNQKLFGRPEQATTRVWRWPSCGWQAEATHLAWQPSKDTC